MTKQQFFARYTPRPKKVRQEKYAQRQHAARRAIDIIHERKALDNGIEVTHGT
ncbi:PA3496 family putative envelope integrity protein [Photobacterium indicum]|uniref:PA3496 family putative envelope integrity protein n=1 Tax=Photobacterium indicum TaxID=81447 RepID=UPI003D14FF32